MKKFMLLIVLVTAAALLCACSPSDNTNDVNAGAGQAAPMDQLPTLIPVAVTVAQAPAAEQDSGFTAVSNKVYAGATPVPIDPIDMPTATPRPAVTFTYADYTAANLGLTFKAAAGFDVNDSMSNMYILTEPAASVKDNYPCVISFEISSVSSNYGPNNVKTDLAGFLENEGKMYSNWETWKADARELLGGKGYYNNYRGVLADGTIVRGRVHMALIGNNQLLRIHISAPGWYNESYMKIYDQIRSTLKRTN